MCTDEIVRAKIDGPFEVGARGRVRYKGAPSLPFAVVVVSPPYRYVTEVRVPLLRLEFDHRIEPTDSGSRISERVTFDGPLGGLVGATRGRAAEAKWQLAIGRMLALATGSSPR